MLLLHTTRPPLNQDPPSLRDRYDIALICDNRLVGAAEAPARSRRLPTGAQHVPGAANVGALLEVVHRVAKFEAVVPRSCDERCKILLAAAAEIRVARHAVLHVAY